MHSLACSRQDNATFPPHIHQTLPKPYSGALFFHPEILCRFPLRCRISLVGNRARPRMLCWGHIKQLLFRGGITRLFVIVIRLAHTNLRETKKQLCRAKWWSDGSGIHLSSCLNKLHIVMLIRSIIHSNQHWIAMVTHRLSREGCQEDGGGLYRNTRLALWKATTMSPLFSLGRAACEDYI